MNKTQEETTFDEMAEMAETTGIADPDWEDRSVIITAAGKECLVFRALLQQALPLLRRPERFTTEERRQLAQTIVLALEENFDADNANDEDDMPECEAEREEVW